MTHPEEPSAAPAAVPLPEPLQRLLQSGSVRVDVRGRRADVVLDAPQRLNSQNPDVWQALAAAAEWLDDRVDVVVLRGEGRSFSAGLDRRAFTPQGLPGGFGVAALTALDDDALDAQIAEYQRGFTGWSAASFISLAAVQGHAIGAGFQLALACDLRIAADDVQFAMREPALGLVPDLGGTLPLVEAVGYGRALELCATARPVSAAQAQEYGLVHAVVPLDGLDAEVDRWVAGLLANDPAAVRATRRLLQQARGHTLAQQCAAERAAQRDRLRALAAMFAQR